MTISRSSTRFLAVALALALGVTVEAQDQPDSIKIARVTPRWTTGSVNVQVGTARLGLAGLNESLVRNGRPEFSTDVATIGFSSRIRLGRFLLGGGGETAVTRREESLGWITKVSFGSAMLDAGVAIVDTHGLLIYPQVSLGMRKTSLRMDRSGDFTYEEGVQDPARGVALSSRSGLVQMGLVVEKQLSTSRTGAFSIGLRAGTVEPFGGPATFAGESRVHGAPREESGRYLRLSVGKPIGNKRDALSALSGALLSIIGG